MGLEMIGRLRDLLTSDNVYYLDEMLEILTNPKASTAAYPTFWAAFNARMGHQALNVVNSPEAKVAWNALHRLQAIVQDYRKENDHG